MYAFCVVVCGGDCADCTLNSQMKTSGIKEVRYPVLLKGHDAACLLSLSNFMFSSNFSLDNRLHYNMKL